MTSKKHKASNAAHKNKLGVENTLVNNINAKKKCGTSHPKKDATVTKGSYDQMQHGWK